MAQNTFSMHRLRQGEMKYLLLTIIPPLIAMQLISILLQHGFLPAVKSLSAVYFAPPLAGMVVLGYFLIFKKNHQLEVKDNTIIETNWLNKEALRLKTSQIRSFRRNLLCEIVLLDENEKRLLCVEANMSNFDQFEQWLYRHSIYQNKE